MNVAEIIKLILRFLFRMPPDFRTSALKEIEEGPQKDFYEYLDRKGQREYLNDLTSQHSQAWLCQNAAFGNIMQTLTFFGVLFLFVHDGLTGTLFSFGAGALKTVTAVISILTHRSG